MILEHAQLTSIVYPRVPYPYEERAPCSSAVTVFRCHSRYEETKLYTKKLDLAEYLWLKLRAPESSATGVGAATPNVIAIPIGQA